MTTPGLGGGALTAAVEFARRAPGKALALILGLHLVVWTIVPILVCPNLQLDLADELALGKEWQLGYWKHPPLPWWLAEATYQLTGQIDAVYVLGPLVVAAALYAVWLLAHETVGGFTGLIAVVALEGVHYYNFSAVKFNHDTMQLPFWGFTALFFYRALKRGARVDWVLAGVFLAGAFWSKYTAFVLAATLGLFMLADPQARRAWRSSGPYLMAVAFAIVIAPNVWWLFGHDFLPFRYAGERSPVATHWYQYFVFSLQWIGSQTLNLLPAAGLLALLYLGTKPGERTVSSPAAFDRRYVTWLALAPIALITILAGALGRFVFPRWGYPLWSFAPLALVMWLNSVTEMRSLRRFASGFVAVFVAVPILYVATELGEPLLRDRPKATQFPGRALADIVTAEWRRRYGTPLTFVGGSEFLANNVAVYSPDRPHVVVQGELRLSPWVDKDELRRRGAVLVWGDDTAAAELPTLKANFGDMDVQPVLVLPRQTWRPVRPERIGYAIVPPRP